MTIFRIVIRNSTNGDEWGLTNYHTTLSGAIAELDKMGYKLGQQPPSNLFSSAQETVIIVDK